MAPPREVKQKIGATQQTPRKKKAAASGLANNPVHTPFPPLPFPCTTRG